ncbi:MAG: lipopolysaccharide heptosyltransferase II, partial [Fimbriimonadales bacterium]|nr:lipopolysaccharide heptosyltransferase II [Fimbriimonadales bacterium]
MRHPVDLNRIERLLILKVSSMGDIVHASPVAAALKRAFPHLYIGWIAEDRHAGVIEGSPRIDRLHIIPHKALRQKPFGREARQIIARLARELRAERYQVALDLQGLLKSAIWGVLGRVPIRYGAHRMRELTPLLLRRIPIPERPDRHVVQQYLDAARWLGASGEFPDLYASPDDANLPEPPVEFPLYVPDEARQQVAYKLAQLGADGKPLISMNPSAGRDWNRWDIAKFAELSDRIEAEWGAPVVFVGGPGDKPLEERLRELKKRPLRSLIGRTTLKEAMAVVERSAVHICGDTGTAHIAAAFRTPVVSLYGPTSPDRTGPYGQRARALYKRPLCTACPPDKCMRKECLQWITVDEVMAAAQPLLRLSLIHI